MTDLNTALLDEGNRASAEGREPCFHYSPTLSTVLAQIDQHGVIANSINDGEDFLEFIDNLGHQFQPFNILKVIAVNAADYDMLDPQQKFVFSHIMEFVHFVSLLKLDGQLTILAARSSARTLSS